VVRHSGATQAQVAVNVRDDAVDLVVEDNGRGLKVTAMSGDGSGMRGMQERALALHGTVEVGPGPTGGTKVEAHLPFEASS
jgi:signal transduction histidine kinase